MARKKSGLDMSPESRAERTRAKREEMKAQGFPFGQYPDGTARTRPEVPEKMRSHYLLLGMPRGKSSFNTIGRFKSRKAVQRAMDSMPGVFRDAYHQLQVVRCKLIEEIVNE